MWDVIGYETNIDENGTPYAYTVYAVKTMKQKPGEVEGQKARRIWYRSAEIQYVPQVGDSVIIDTETRGKFEVVTDIERV